MTNDNGDPPRPQLAVDGTLTDAERAAVGRWMAAYGVMLGPPGPVTGVPVLADFPPCPVCGRVPSAVNLTPGTLNGGTITYEGCEHTLLIPRKSGDAA